MDYKSTFPAKQAAKSLRFSPGVSMNVSMKWPAPRFDAGS